MNNALTSLRQLILFCGVGVLNTVFSLLIILGLSEYFQVHYIYANIIGYLAGLILGFTLHKFITFKSHAGAQAAHWQFLKFLAVFGAGYLAQLCALLILVEILFIGNITAQIAAWVFYVAISFLGNKLFTFSPGRT